MSHELNILPVSGQAMIAIVRHYFRKQGVSSTRIRMRVYQVTRTYLDPQNVLSLGIYYPISVSNDIFENVMQPIYPASQITPRKARNTKNWMYKMQAISNPNCWQARGLAVQDCQTYVKGWYLSWTLFPFTNHLPYSYNGPLFLSAESERFRALIQFNIQDSKGIIKWPGSLLDFTDFTPDVSSDLLTSLQIARSGFILY
ncbi:hypothetical protein C8Q75DRAFT_731514 [Abortiporus biennis]|nr:hypothetical protein C8Q75DRAFT_731514 [Abortiporus biennis]